MDFSEYDARLAAYAVIERDDHVLLALWNEPAEPLWTLPGGGVERHETVEEAAVREVREETGYDVELVRLLGVHTRVVPAASRLIATDRVLRSVGVVYEARVVGGELTHEVRGSTDEARWFPVDEVDALERVDLVDDGLVLWRAQA